MRKIQYNGALPITLDGKPVKQGDTPDVSDAAARELLAYPNGLWTEPKTAKPAKPAKETK